MKHSTTATIVLVAVLGLYTLIAIAEHLHRPDRKIDDLDKQGWHKVEVRVIDKDTFQIRRIGATSIVEVHRERPGDATTSTAPKHLLPTAGTGAKPVSVPDAGSDPNPDTVGNHGRRIDRGHQPAASSTLARTVEVRSATQ